MTNYSAIQILEIRSAIEQVAREQGLEAIIGAVGIGNLSFEVAAHLAGGDEAIMYGA